MSDDDGDYEEDAFDEEDAFEDDEDVPDEPVRDEPVHDPPAAARDLPAAVRDTSSDEMLAQYLNSSKQPPILSLLRRQSLSALGRVEAVLGPHAAETLRPIEGAYRLEATWAREAPEGTTTDAAAARTGRELTAQELADGGLVLAWTHALAHPLVGAQFWALLSYVLIVLQLPPNVEEDLDGAGAGGDAPKTVAEAVAKAVAEAAAAEAAREEAASEQDAGEPGEGQRELRWRLRQETRAQLKAAVRERAVQVVAMEGTLRAAEEEVQASERHFVDLKSKMTEGQIAMEITAMRYSLPGEESEYSKVQAALEATNKAYGNVVQEHRDAVYLSEDAQRAARRELIRQILEAGDDKAGNAQLEAEAKAKAPVAGKEGWRRAKAGVPTILGRAGVELGQVQTTLDEDKVLLDSEMQMLRDMTAATAATALSIAVRRALLRPPAVTAEAREALAPLLLDVAWRRAETYGELGGEGAAGALTLLRFVQATADFAAARGCLGELLRAGCRVDTIDADGESALHACCGPARPALLKTLLEGCGSGDIDVAARSDGCSTIARLMAASSDKQVRCVELLLDANAAIELQAGPPNGQPTTLLHLAVRSGKPRPLEAVLRKLHAAAAASGGFGGFGCGKGGGKGGGKGKGGKVALIDRTDGGGATPLCAAVCAHEQECVRLLLRHHARLLARDGSGATPLHHAVVSGDVLCCHTLLAAVPPSSRRTLLTAADPTQKRGSLAHRSPLAMAAGQPTGGALEAMVSAAPALFADAAQLPLHLRLLDAAMEAPCESDGTHATVTLLICHCAPLQQRLLRLMKLCARAERSVLLPLVCKHADVNVEAVDGRGHKLLHALCAMEPGAAGSFPAEAIDETRDAIDEAEEKGPTTGSATTGGGRPGRIHGPTLLRALLTAQPQIHLFAIDGGGLTALGRTPRTSQCSALLMAATQRALQQAAIHLIYCRREGPSCAPHVDAVREELTGTFPGLRVMSKPMVGRGGASDDGARAGTFDVVWEANDWRHNNLLYTRSATGSFPPPGALTRAVMSVILGPGMPLAELREWQPLLLRALWGIHFHRDGGAATAAAASSEITQAAGLSDAASDATNPAGPLGSPSRIQGSQRGQLVPLPGSKSAGLLPRRHGQLPDENLGFDMRLLRLGLRHTKMKTDLASLGGVLNRSDKRHADGAKRIDKAISEHLLWRSG